MAETPEQIREGYERIHYLFVSGEDWGEWATIEPLLSAALAHAASLERWESEKVASGLYDIITDIRVMQTRDAMPSEYDKFHDRIIALVKGSE
jgi:hypothetical protein